MSITIDTNSNEHFIIFLVYNAPKKSTYSYAEAPLLYDATW